VISLTVNQFAQLAMVAAEAVPASTRYRGERVWIIDASNVFVLDHPEVSLAEFKRRLWEAHQARKITLGRADTPGWGGEPELIKDRASTIAIGSFATFQVIKL
jgi:hypothetical protein